MARTPTTRWPNPCASTWRSCQVMKLGSMVTKPMRPPIPSAARRLASPSPTTGISTAPRISSTRLLEMPDDEGIVAIALCFNSVADHLRRAAEFRQRVEVTIGGSRPWTSNFISGAAT